MTAEELLNSHRIYLSGDVDGDMLAAFDKQIEDYLKSDVGRSRPITLVLSSPGGMLSVAMALFDRIRLFSKVLDLSVIAVGPCCSAAAVVFVATEKAKRFTTSNSHFLLHEVSRKASEFNGGSIRQRDIEVDKVMKSHEWMTVEMKRMTNLLAKECGISKKEMRKLLEAETSLIGQEAVELGLAAGVVH